MDNNSNGKSRLEYLDGLRGIGALMVVLNHFCGVFGMLFAPGFMWITMEPPLTLLTNARYAVFIFFVLSGFVLSKSVFPARKGSLGLLLLARYLRLTVPMLASLVFSRLALYLVPHARFALEKEEPVNIWYHRSLTDLPTMWGAIQQGLYGVYVFGDDRMNGVVWTMRKEFLGSIVIYLLYRFCPRQLQLWALGIFVAVTLYSPVYLGFPVGALVFEAWQRGWIRESKWRWLVVGFLSALLASTFQYLLLENASGVLSFLRSDALYLTIAAGLLIYAVMTNEIPQKVLASTVIHFFGRISFGIYLFHFPLLITFAAWLYLHLAMSQSVNLLLTFVSFAAATILVAWLVTITIDEPLVKRLHRLKKTGVPATKAVLSTA